MDSKLSSVSLSNNNNKLNNNNSQLKQQNLVQNGHISLSSFVEKINNNNNLIDNTSSSAVSNIEKKPIRLNSPIGASAISWHWSEKEKNNIGIEVVDIIRFVWILFVLGEVFKGVGVRNRYFGVLGSNVHFCYFSRFLWELFVF